MEFRIGVNVGDVVQEEERIYGDGVNIAARVESMSQAGGICISGRAYDQVANKLGLEYENLGEHQVKNISTPIRVYRVLTSPGETAYGVIQAKHTLKKKWLWAAASTIIILLIIFVGLYRKYYYLPAPIEMDPNDKIVFELSQGPSIAVLPFTNMNKDSSLNLLCDGVTENIISALSHVPQLFVIARNSTFAYAGKSINVQQIGQELGVQYLIEGSIQKSNEHIRITVKLIDTGSGNPTWSQRFDRKLNDIFKLQDEIAINIIKAMQIYLTEGDQMKTRFEGITDFQTSIKLMKALNYHRQFSKESNVQARKILEEVVAENNKLSGGYVLLGIVYLMSIPQETCESSLICFGRATEAARIALSLDKNNSDAHILTSAIYLHRKEYEKAIADVKRAIRLNPNNADAYCQFGFTLTLCGRPVEAIQYFKKAMRLNPIPPAYYLSLLAVAYADSSQYEKAIETWKKCLDHQSNYIYAFVGLAATYALLGQANEANAAALAVLEIDPAFTIEKSLMSMPYKNKADLERAVKALREAGFPE
jgi:adenylate cyclase